MADGAVVARKEIGSGAMPPWQNQNFLSILLGLEPLADRSEMEF